MLKTICDRFCKKQKVIKITKKLTDYLIFFVKLLTQSYTSNLRKEANQFCVKLYYIIIPKARREFHPPISDIRYISDYLFRYFRITPDNYEHLLKIITIVYNKE